jgi:hypothetical protein
MLEQMLIILLIFGFLLFSMLVEWLKRRQRQASREIRPTVPPAPVRAPMPVPPRAVGARRPRAESRGTPQPLDAAPPGRSPRAYAYIRNRREVRRGIVLMTILGPCRALEPPYPRQ